MKTIYIDGDFKCHNTNDGTFTEVKTDYFYGKCDAFIEGYCYKDNGNGVTVYPWKDHAELDAAQRAYERQCLAEYTEYLKILGVEV